MRGSDYYLISTEDREEWLEIIERAEQLDIAFHPDYLRSLECLDQEKSAFGGRGRLFVYDSGEGTAICPFMLKSLSGLDPRWRGDDISSPYGYSGPVWISPRRLDRPICEGFRNAFDDFCTDQGIVTEFYRPNPFLQRCDSGGDGTMIDHGPMVYIDLVQDMETIHRDFKKNCRQSINKATRSGVTIRASPKDGADIREFTKIYDETMKRSQAETDYYFPEEFYRRLAAMEESTLLLAEHEGQVVSALWLLAYGNSAHAFLGGTNVEGRNLNAFYLILAEAISRSKLSGWRVFCFGGGHGHRDGVLDFKLSFSRTTAPFRTFRKVHDLAMYEDVCTATGVSSDLDQYFPPYRGVGR
ncbi:MAG: GNAT family N-acetyltransferase [Methanomassiliicoccus sp.]|nr:GNAT family N-acetyltransferase [Methanomassiliicoccus sp.]